MSRNGQGPVTLAELTAGLIWPGIFRASTLALQPSRLAVAFVFVAVVMGFGSLVDWVAGPATEMSQSGWAATYAAEAAASDRGAFAIATDVGTNAFNELALSLLSLAPGEALAALAEIVIGAPVFLFSQHWLLGLLVGGFAAVCWCVTGGAIARMAVCDFAGEAKLTMGEAYGFALPRTAQLTLALLGPIVTLGALALAIAAIGGLLLAIPGLDVVGGLVYGLFLLATLVLVAGAICLALGGSMILPAVAAESTDWFDAIQRAYAYVLGRTGRLASYALGLIAIGAIAYGVAAMVASATLNGSAELMQAWRAGDAPPIAGRVEAFEFSIPEADPALEGGELLAARLAGVWMRIGVALLASYVISYYFCASSVLYLLCRRVNDEQDVHEIWMPGMIESTMAARDEEQGAKDGG